MKRCKCKAPPMTSRQVVEEAISFRKNILKNYKWGEMIHCPRKGKQ